MKNLKLETRNTDIMKHFLSLIILFTGVSTFAQNIDDNKVQFSYIQLPSHPLGNGVTNYSIVINNNFDQANEDSLSLYQMKYDQLNAAYEAGMIAWRDQKNTIDRNHLVAMANWEKQINAGTAAAQPIKPPYPAQPETVDLPLPLTHSDFSDDIITNTINVQGLQKGTGGATVTIDVNPIKNFRVIETKKGEGAAIKYYYSVQYEMPIGLKIESPSKGVVLQTILMAGLQTQDLNNYASKYEYELWLLDNRDKMWEDIQLAARKQIAANVNSELNEKCGYPIKSRGTEVFTVKKFKDHDYNDVYAAYQSAQAGYLMVGNSKDASAPKAKLNEAIKQWETILQESNISDSKSRINDKVTALLYANLAEAYLWLNNFDKAEYYINMAINAGTFKFKNHAQGLQGLLNDRRMRYNANF